MSTRADRFRPSRAGVINVWDYLDEEFVFADGRLVLRGHNGSGKTKALEVLFPFVLDGFTDARRLDPFSGENRTMKSNLLYRGQDAEYGYVWMEFARDAPAATVTLIVGLRAQRARDGVRTSFFVTRKRLGVDFGLLAADSRPLTERQLKAVLEPDAFHDGPTKYRAAVDARLFGLGVERYVQLLDLLLALRRPLLAKDLDPDKVSDTLTAGLSPVDEHLVSQGARDFDNLAAVQKQFDDLTTADTAVRSFLVAYQAYLRMHMKAKLDRITTEKAAAIGHAATIAAAAAELDRATRAHEAAAKARDAAETERLGLERRLAVLKNNDAYRAQGDFDRLRAQIADTKAEIAEEHRRLDRSLRNLEQMAEEAAKVDAGLETVRQEIKRHSADLSDAAFRAGIDLAVGDDAVTDDTVSDDLLESVRARKVIRDEDIADVRGRLELVAGAEADRRHTERIQSSADEIVVRRAAECRAADERLAATRRTARADLAGWVARWAGDDEGVALHADATVLAEALGQIGEPGAVSLRETFLGLAGDRQRAISSGRDRLTAQHEQVEADLRRSRAERAEIAAERDEAPPAGDLRTAERDGRPGAPLWQLVRFADDVADERAAGVEGALYGAGMLTAWIHPDAALTMAAVHAADADGYLIAAEQENRPDGRTLADVLVPEVQEAVPAEVIKDVLRSVALADDLTAPGTTPAVTERAQFSHGIQVGARPKAAPEYIGATNRANRRKARLAEYDQRIAEYAAAAAAAETEIGRLDTLLGQFEQAQRELPKSKPIMQAVNEVAGMATLLTSARTALEDAQKALDAATAEVDAAARALRRTAAERGMPSTAAEVDAVARAVAELTASAERLHRDGQSAATMTNDIVGRRATIGRLTADDSADRRRLAAKEQAYTTSVEEFSTREKALDAPLRKVLADIEETSALIETVADTFAAEDGKADTEKTNVAVAQSNMDHGRASLATAIGVLFEQARSFGPYAHRDLRPLMGVTATTPWPADTDWDDPDQAAAAAAAAMVVSGTEATPAAAVASRLPAGVEELLDVFGARVADEKAPGDAALKSVAGRMSEALRDFGDALSACEEDYRLDYDPTGVVMVHVTDEDGRGSVAGFAAKVADRVGEQGILLEERERTVLEDELLTGLARQIHDRVLSAKELVHGMNADTRSRPMSSGMTIGISWIQSDKINDRQREASRLLDHEVEGLGRDGLARLRSLLREMIRDYRASHPRATYAEVLAGVLDYRTWHTFALWQAVPGQPETRLTRAKHSVMSGGEKSASIHLPLFAAANALYTSAKPTCPRMIALDEAFAGIDDRYKPELLGLTVKYDLDLFMTGHDLWIHYDTVPMAAHYDMHRDEAAHAVSAMLVLWDGVQMIDADAGFAGNDELATTLLGIAPRRHAPPDTGDDLFADANDDAGDDG